MCVDRIPVGDSSFACEDFAAFKPWPPAAGDRSPRCCHALTVIGCLLLPRPAGGIGCLLPPRPAGDRPPRCCHALPVIARPDAAHALPGDRAAPMLPTPCQGIARPDAAHALPMIARPDATHALPVIGCQLLAIRSAPCRAALRRHAATLRCAPAPRLPM